MINGSVVVRWSSSQIRVILLVRVVLFVVLVVFHQFRHVFINGYRGLSRRLCSLSVPSSHLRVYPRFVIKPCFLSSFLL